jgi:hypothetical protein
LRECSTNAEHHERRRAGGGGQHSPPENVMPHEHRFPLYDVSCVFIFLTAPAAMQVSNLDTVTTPGTSISFLWKAIG